MSPSVAASVSDTDASVSRAAPKLMPDLTGIGGMYHVRQPCQAKQASQAKDGQARNAARKVKPAPFQVSFPAWSQNQAAEEVKYKEKAVPGLFVKLVVRG
jgi:hypothetical protein